MNRVGFGQSSFALKATGFTNKANPDAAILALFAGGKQGVWYDPSDKSTLFQDVAGTVPVTKDGDPVALMRDKSGNNNHATQSVSTARPVYKTDGVLHRLVFDGVDDNLLVSDMARNTNTMYIGMGAMTSKLASQTVIGAMGNSRVFFLDSYNVSTFYNKDGDTNDWLSYLNGVILSQPSKRVRIDFNNLYKKMTIIEIGNGNMNTPSFNSIFIGKMESGVHFEGEIADVIICENLDAEKRLNTTRYLANKAGVIM